MCISSCFPILGREKHFNHRNIEVWLKEKMGEDGRFFTIPCVLSKPDSWKDRQSLRYQGIVSSPCIMRTCLCQQEILRAITHVVFLNFGFYRCFVRVVVFQIASLYVHPVLAGTFYEYIYKSSCWTSGWAPGEEIMAVHVTTQIQTQRKKSGRCHTDHVASWLIGPGKAMWGCWVE